MSKKKVAPTFNWADFTDEQLFSLMKLIGGDGHTIYSSKWLREHDVDERIIRKFAHKIESDFGDPKTIIYQNDRPVPNMVQSVYGLNVLWSLASHFNVTTNKMGRGFQAQDLTSGIYKALRNKSGM